MNTPDDGEALHIALDQAYDELRSAMQMRLKVFIRAFPLSEDLNSALRAEEDAKSNVRITRSRKNHPRPNDSERTLRTVANSANKALTAAQRRRSMAAKAYDKPKDIYANAHQAVMDRTVHLNRVAAALTMWKQSQPQPDLGDSATMRTLSADAGLPYPFLVRIDVRRKIDSRYDIFYGGEDKAAGRNHGHIVILPTGKVSYHRPPYARNGINHFGDECDYVSYRKCDNVEGGYGPARHTYMNKSPITIAIGWGTKTDHAKIASGHVDVCMFDTQKNIRRVALH
ncbi:MAG: hypothetical protein ABIR91_01960 [Candidatus Saccharimonadales bacterium]